MSRELAFRWSMWLLSLEPISSLRFPRCVIPDEFVDGSLELHHFCDASEVGYGSCTYVGAIYRRGQIHVSLLISKNRLAVVVCRPTVGHCLVRPVAGVASVSSSVAWF